MTLIITELKNDGIVMVADSAITSKITTPRNQEYTRIRTGAKKLQKIEYLQAGISMWGLGCIEGIPTDVWVEEFIEMNLRIKTIDTFVKTLTRRLNEVLGKIDEPLGFHIAGFVEHDGIKKPTFYHTRNSDGPYQNYHYHEFVSGNDIPPTLFPKGRGHTTRNGDFGPYAGLVDKVNEVLPAISSIFGSPVPHPSIESRIDYHTAWVKFVSDLYACSKKERTKTQ